MRVIGKVSFGVTAARGTIGAGWETKSMEQLKNRLRRVKMNLTTDEEIEKATEIEEIQSAIASQLRKYISKYGPGRVWQALEWIYRSLEKEARNDG